ncbi:MAG: peptidase MA family metallohydrolase [bacterium]
MLLWLAYTPDSLAFLQKLINSTPAYSTPTHTAHQTAIPEPMATMGYGQYDYNPNLLESARQHFAVTYHNEEKPSEIYINYTLAALESNRERLLHDFGFSQYPTVAVEFFTNRKQFRDATGGIVDRGYPLRGLSRGGKRLAFFIDLGDFLELDYGSFYHVAAHEFAHELTSAKFASFYNDIPLWFVEGLAEYESRPLDRIKSDYLFVRNSSLKEHVSTLDKLSSAQETETSVEDIELAYPTSLSFTNYLVTTYGYTKVMQIPASMPRSRYDFSRAFYAVTREKLDDVYAGWFQGLSK